MALTLQSVYAPLKDYFLKQFSSDPASPVFFRFSKYGSTLSDQDFMDPAHPEFGCLASLATEKFSDLVNHIPLDAGDGVNIVLSDGDIDSTYFFRLLSPSMPWIPDGADDTTRQSLLDAFGNTKASARRLWDNLKLESSSGLMMSFKPSLATPEGWYDKSKNDAWTTHSFTLSDTTTVTTPGAAQPLWKLRIPETQLEQLSVDPQAPSQLNNIMIVQPAAPTRMQAMAESPGLAVAPPVTSTPVMRKRPLMKVSPAAHFAAAADVAPVATAPVMANRSFQVKYVEQYHAMSVRQRVQVDRYVGQRQPTQTVQTSTITISFDFCLVNIDRPWYVAAFIDAPAWYVPGVPKGSISTAGPIGNLSMMPVGFVAVRNLSIEASWSAQDLAAAANATDFGPFKVSGELVGNKLTRSGIQIIGWLLENVPTLPPNEPQ